MQSLANFKIQEPLKAFEALIELSRDFDLFSLLNSNNLKQDRYSNYQWLASFGSADSLRLEIDEPNAFEKVDGFITQHKHQWKFANISYDLKNHIEKLKSEHPDPLNFSDIFIFVPQFVILAREGTIEFLFHESIDIKTARDFAYRIESYESKTIAKHKSTIDFKHRISKEVYLRQLTHIKDHILYGDIYEMNFCQEFYAENVNIDPQSTYHALNKKSPTPFSAFTKEGDRYIICASPERYIQKMGSRILSQPIKGTAKRNPIISEDEKVKLHLKSSVKERAENIMIVDLVRNDLSRIKGIKNVKVDALCEIYSFKQVHQMISTISATLRPETSFGEILKSTFPMGSMTGAPKISAMELIEKYENSRRAAFSGSVGYIDPDGNFDFNVIIRSLLYNEANRYLSITTGGAITNLCDAKSEYEESLLKAEAIFSIFGKNG